VFGEFPVRRELGKYTKFPVVIPTPTPAYNSSYDSAFLEAHGKNWGNTLGGTDRAAFAAAIQADAVRGYCRVLHEYLTDVCQANPKEGLGARTTLFGLQTPPLNGQLNYIRTGSGTTFDDVAPQLYPFFATNAFSQVEMSCDPSNAALADTLNKLGVPTTTETDDAFEGRMATAEPFNIIRPDKEDVGFPLAGQFISVLFCVGHVKSSRGGDDHFLETFRNSDKWLAMRN